MQVMDSVSFKDHVGGGVIGIDVYRIRAVECCRGREANVSDDHICDSVSHRKYLPCDHLPGFRSQRCFFNSESSPAESDPASLVPMFASTCVRLRMPGMIVLTSGLLRIKRRAISDSVIPAGSNPFSFSARSTLGNKFSGTK